MTTPVGTRDIPNAAQLTVRMTQGGQPAAIVLGALVPAEGLTQEQGQVWLNEAWTSFRTFINQSVTCIGGTLRHLDTNVTDVFELSAPPSPTGGGTSSSLALATGSSLIKWKTVNGTRSGKGRTFLPGLQADSVAADGRTYTPAFQALLGTQGLAYVNSSALATANVNPAVLSFKNGVAYEITGATGASIVGLQRRRMRA